MDLSIIIAYHNEGFPFIKETVDQINRTIDVSDYEIIIIDDFSDEPLRAVPGAIVIRHESNNGVGAAFDTGVQVAKSENIIIMGSDIRFIPNQWASKMLEEIKNFPQALTCTSCVVLTDEETNIQKQIDAKQYRGGATLDVITDKKIYPDKPNNWRSILDARWFFYLPITEEESYEVPCLLGALYGVNKQWYQYIDGWNKHKKWSTLEPFISIKSWMFGGSCRVAPHIKTGHIFKKKNAHPHKTGGNIITYNKTVLALLMCPDPYSLLDYYAELYPGVKTQAKNIEETDWYHPLLKKYQSMIKLPFNEYINKFNLNTLST
jgi:glycosyltransferase involved in cell wall biosynthesis